MGNFRSWIIEFWIIAVADRSTMMSSRIHVDIVDEKGEALETKWRYYSWIGEIYQ